jgi:hypothetical protein
VATTWQGKELIRSLYDHENEALAGGPHYSVRVM